MEMSVYSHKANDRFRKDKISILEQLGICISKEKEAEIYNKFSEEEIDSYANATYFHSSAMIDDSGIANLEEINRLKSLINSEK